MTYDEKFKDLVDTRLHLIKMKAVELQLAIDEFWVEIDRRIDERKDNKGT